MTAFQAQTASVDYVPPAIIRPADTTVSSFPVCLVDYSSEVLRRPANARTSDPPAWPGPLDAFLSRLRTMRTVPATKFLEEGFAAITELMTGKNPPVAHMVYNEEEQSLTLELIGRDRRLGFSVEDGDACWFYVENGGQRRIDSGNVNANTDFSELVSRMKK
ncbi:MAG: hypothetical protein B6A08_04215 [Sorangiineae bacterium NIC37A_2]|nr:MAG: hypothetical protein B6A08_04215 [Sorangiineae bacterium NIC37A_2]